MADTYTYLAPVFPSMSGVIERTSDMGSVTFVPLDLGNTDYQGFLAWMAEGNAAPNGWTGPTNTSG